MPVTQQRRGRTLFGGRTPDVDVAADHPNPHARTSRYADKYETPNNYLGRGELRSVWGRFSASSLVVLADEDFAAKEEARSTNPGVLSGGYAVPPKPGSVLVRLVPDGATSSAIRNKADEDPDVRRTRVAVSAWTNLQFSVVAAAAVRGPTSSP